MSHLGGPPMAPGPPRQSLAPGPPPGMQPGMSMASMTLGQPPPLSMAPGAASTLPIQPLNMAPGMAPVSGPANGAPRPLVPGPAPGTQPLSISPLNMPSASGQPPAPQLGMSAAQVLNLNLQGLGGLQGQPNPAAFPQGLAQQAAPQSTQQASGLKRPAESSGPPDNNSSAKRVRTGEADGIDSANQAAAVNAAAAVGAGAPKPPGVAPGGLSIGGQVAAAGGALPPQAQPIQAPANLGGLGQGAGGATPNPADIAALLLGNRANPYAAAYQQAAALQQAAAAQAAAQAAARRRAAAAAAAAADPDDERRLLPRRGVRMALRAAGMDKDFVVDPATEAALLEFYTEWIGNAVALGCEVSKRRKSNVLKARDIAIHLERSWNLYIPGFNGDVLKPYRRPHASELHRQRQLAVRRTAAELDHHQQHQPHHHHTAAGPPAAVGAGGLASPGLVSGVGVAGAVGGTG